MIKNGFKQVNPSSDPMDWSYKITDIKSYTKKQISISNVSV